MSSRIPIAAPDIREAERLAVDRVLADGQLADGPEVRRFERAFAAFCGAEAASATTNGTTALQLALEALDVGPGDAVITSPFSFVASANAIRHAGAEVVFADVEPGSLTLDPDAVDAAAAGNDDVAGVLPVHLYGRPARMDALVEVAEAQDLVVVEDACQAHGASFDGDRVGTLGDAAVFSFYPTKNVTAGEGGMVTTDRRDVAERVARLADHGRTGTYEHETVGYNYRMTSLCAAIGRVQLDRLPAYNLARRGNAAYLDRRLAEAAVETPPTDDSARAVYHQYTVRLAERDALADHLDREGIETGVYYPIPIHRQPAYAGVTAPCPVAERAAGRVLSLPVHPGLTAADLDRIATAVEAFEPRHYAATEEARPRA